MSNEVTGVDKLAPSSLEQGQASKSNTREWDGEDAIDAFPGARLEAEDALEKEYLASLEEVEAQEAEPEAPVEEEFVGEEQVEEPVEEQTEEAIEEPVQEEPQFAQVEEPVTPKAQQRIQKLVAEKKEAQSKMEQLLEKLAAAEVARQEAETRRQQEVAYERSIREQEQMKQLRMRQLEEAGFDPTDPRNQYMLAVDDVILKQTAELNQIKAKLQQKEQEETIKGQWDEFNGRLDRAFESTLAGRKLDADAYDTLKKAAVALAYSNQSADPIEEVRTVLRPYMKLLKTAEAPAPKAAPPPPQNTQAHRAISLKGTTGNKKAGDKPGQVRPGKVSMDQAREVMWGSSKTVWDR